VKTGRGEAGGKGLLKGGSAKLNLEGATLRRKIEKARE